MKNRLHPSQQGQSLVLVAFLTVVLIGMLVLTLDAGYSFVMRRQAQNAADAGALAGAAVLCSKEDDGAPATVASNYVSKNGAVADPASDIIVNLNARKVQVTAHITFNTFFAGIFGHPTVTAAAVARAGCYSPEGIGVLPISFACRPMVNQNWMDPSQTSCVIEGITWPELESYLPIVKTEVRDGLYVIMDNLKYDSDMYCKEDYPGGELTCEFDSTPGSNYLAQGGRSWIDLDGGQEADNCPQTQSSEGIPELSDWIRNGYPCEFHPHTWVPEQTGVVDPLFEDIRDKGLVFLPVYDQFCPTNLGDPSLPANQAQCKWHSSEPNEYVMKPDGNNKPTFFHIINFSAFYVTCVNDSVIKIRDGEAVINNGNGGGNGGGNGNQKKPCPGIAAFIENNLENLSNGNFSGAAEYDGNFKVKSIEGYFLRGSIPGLTGRNETGPDTGVYTVYLDK